MIRYNKLISQFDHDRIAKDFRIFRFASSDQYIKYGALILDLIDSSLNANSIVFEGGKTFYGLFGSDENLFDLRGKMKSISEADNLEVVDETGNIKNIPNHILLKLLLNSTVNAEHEILKYNNLTGQLYLIASENLQRWSKRDNLIIKVPALKLDVDSQMRLSLSVITFTNLSLKNKLRFDKKKLHEYARYTFLPGQLSMRRVLPSENLDLDKIYIIKQEEGKKSIIPFFNFESKDKFDKSKLGQLYQFWKKVEASLSDYLQIRFSELKQTRSFEFEKEINKLKKERIDELLNTFSINLEDTIQDEESTEFIKDFMVKLKSIKSDLKVSLNQRLDDIDVNIRLVHNEEHYSKFNLVDPYQTNSDEKITQHLTLEDFDESSEAAIQNILKELAIKSDITKTQVRITDWSKFNYSNDWLFITKEDDQFYFLTITPSGQLNFESHEPDILASHHYADLINIYDSESINDIEGLILSPKGDINIIERTKLYTLPDFITVGNELYMTSQPFQLSKREVIDLFKELTNAHRFNAKQLQIIEDYLEQINRINDDQLGRSELTELVKDRTLKKLFTQWMYKKTGHLLYHYFRDQRRYDLLDSNLDIKYVIDENSKAGYYFVGEKGKGIQAKFPKASIIRRIRPHEESKIFFEELIPTLNVDFVRNESLTVLPFPFKYLREYIEANINKEGFRGIS
ncbi:MAG: ATPase [Ekhidna sp.]